MNISDCVKFWEWDYSQVRIIIQDNYEASICFYGWSGEDFSKLINKNTVAIWKIKWKQ